MIILGYYCVAILLAKMLTWATFSQSMCTFSFCINPHMMYGSCDMECDGQNFLSSWTVSCPFTPPTTRSTNQNFEKMKKQKNKNNNKKKTHPEILSFYTCVP